MLRCRVDGDQLRAPQFLPLFFVEFDNGRSFARILPLLKLLSYAPRVPGIESNSHAKAHANGKPEAANAHKIFDDTGQGW